MSFENIKQKYIQNKEIGVYPYLDGETVKIKTHLGEMKFDLTSCEKIYKELVEKLNLLIEKDKLLVFVLTTLSSSDIEGITIDEVFYASSKKELFKYLESVNFRYNKYLNGKTCLILSNISDTKNIILEDELETEYLVFNTSNKNSDTHLYIFKLNN